MENDKEYHDKVKGLIGRSAIMISCEEEYLDQYNNHYKELAKKGIFSISNVSKKNRYTFIENGKLVSKSKEDIHKLIKQKGISEADIEFWNKILEITSEKISKPSFDTFFKGTLAYRLGDQSLIVIALNSFAGDWLKNRYIDFIKDIIKYEYEYEYELDLDISVEIMSELMPRGK